MKITDTDISTAQPKDKDYKLAIGKGMYLLVKPNGAKYFRLDYRLDGKRLTLALGVYPETSLDTAISLCDTAKQHIKDGIKPTVQSTQPTVQSTQPTVQSIEPIVRDNGIKMVKFTITREQPRVLIAPTPRKVTEYEQELRTKWQQEAQGRIEEKNKNKALNAALITLTNKTQAQIDSLFIDDSPAMAKLRALQELRVERGIDSFTDEELADELKRRRGNGLNV